MSIAFFTADKEVTMRVLLIYPASGIESRLARKEPLGICYISAYLKKFGHTTKVIDQIDETDGEMMDMIRAFQPDIIGFSTMTYNYQNGLHLAKLIKSEYSGMTIFFGGTHASGMPEIVKESAIDLVVIGEGELTTLELVNTLAPDSGPADFEKIKGIAFLKDNREVCLTAMRERIVDLDALPFPDKSDLPMHQYKGRDLKYLLHRRMSTIHTSRGCSGNCTFCTTPVLYKNGWISRSAANIADEIEYLIREYKIKTIYFADEDFMHDKKRILDICSEIIKRRLIIFWFCFGKITDIEPGILRRMRQAGCIDIMFGIEAMHDESLKKIAKRISVENTRQAIRIARKTGLIISGTYMIGYPWETYEDLMSGLNELKKLKLDHVYLNYITPYPGTPFYKDCKRNHLIGNYSLECYDCHNPIVAGKLPPYLNNLSPPVFQLKMQKKLNFNLSYIIKVLRNIVWNYTRYLTYRLR